MFLTLVLAFASTVAGGACGAKKGGDTTGSSGGGSASSAATGTGGATASTGASTSAAGGDTTSSTTTGAGGSTVDAGPIMAPQPLSPFIVVDQFGYRPAAEKVAVIRSPQTGFDTGMTFTPGAMYALVDAHSGDKVLEAAPAAWNGGAMDASSGDKAWWFDFSSVKTVGDYFVLDETNAVRSDVFAIADGVYRDVLTQAMRMLYYQRDGIAKDAAHAGAAWVDAAAHMSKCYLYSDTTKTGDKDLHGGWWDAGDFNKYTNWGAEDILQLLRAYEENPAAFTDDSNIPESGNGVPDVLDEAKWELDWLTRMQNADGSVLSVVDEPAAPAPSFGNPADTSPSKVTAACKYGPATTSASTSTAAAFAYASRIFKASSAASKAYPGAADDFASRAKQAYTWAKANTGVTFFNSKNGVAAGEQEVDASGLLVKQLEAALYLFQLTGDTTYRDFIDTNYTKLNLIATGYAGPYNVAEQDTLLVYAKTTGATATVASNILAKYKSAAASDGNVGSVKKKTDPYRAYLSDYTWGSNQIKADQGNVYYDLLSYGVDPTNADAASGAEGFIHYIHGVNPLQIVYLSNMGDHGAAKSATRFFHSWYQKGSLWDAVGVSKYAPPPGYLTGGPSTQYTWDSCCPSSCSGNSCGSAPPSPPTGQPQQKSYKDFNDPWPLDSWAITEPDDGYQVKYIRLLSKFVK